MWHKNVKAILPNKCYTVFPADWRCNCGVEGMVVLLSIGASFSSMCSDNFYLLILLSHSFITHTHLTDSFLLTHTAVSLTLTSTVPLSSLRLIFWQRNSSGSVIFHSIFFLPMCDCVGRLVNDVLFSTNPKLRDFIRTLKQQCEKFHFQHEILHLNHDIVIEGLLRKNIEEQ